MPQCEKALQKKVFSINAACIHYLLKGAPSLSSLMYLPLIGPLMYPPSSMVKALC